MRERRATARDMDAIMAMYHGAQMALGELGVDQWQDGYPTEAIVREDIALGRCWLFEEEQAGCAARAVGVSALVFGEDATYAVVYDGAWRYSGDYATVHRIAVAPGAKRRGVATRMLATLERMAREGGAELLRADTHQDNRPMRSLMEKNGFEYCGVILLENGAPRVAYEKKIR